jgi:hypothetical protein
MRKHAKYVTNDVIHLVAEIGANEAGMINGSMLLPKRGTRGSGSKSQECIIHPRARICKPFRESRNRFPAWRAGTTTLFVVPARHAT